MASLPECEQALKSLAERLADVPAHVRGKYVVSRRLACRVPDLDVVFLAQLGDDGLVLAESLGTLAPLRLNRRAFEQAREDSQHGRRQQVEQTGERALVAERDAAHQQPGVVRCFDDRERRSFRGSV